MQTADLELIKDLGDRVDARLLFYIRDANDVPQLADPTVVTVKVRRPDGFEYDDSANCTKDSTGTYNYHFTPTMYDIWDVRAIGTGNVEQTITLKVRVLRSPFTNP